jgi:hypothetical protein
MKIEARHGFLAFLDIGPLFGVMVRRIFPSRIKDFGINLRRGHPSAIEPSRVLGWNNSMDPYAKPNERKIGAKWPKISHLPSAIETRTRSERQAEKQAVAAERRAIKKSARRHLKEDLLADLDETV